MELAGWGQYPRINSELVTPLSQQEVIEDITKGTQPSLIARGLGRSYGDSSLASRVISTQYLNHFLQFDEHQGLLTCSAGVSLADILSTFVPKGWFLPVTPGTKYVTVGGAISSDVHGKNHHLEGCFSDHVRSLKIATVSDGILECSRELRPDLFRATCGGMGLTGIIVEATFQLKPINSAFVSEITLKARNLEEILYLLDAHQDATYSVAWIDCLASGGSLGRSLLMLGEHHSEGGLNLASRRGFSIPIDMPSFLLNRYSIQVFNALYYARIQQSESRRITHYESFFYPLDSISHWNRLYGKKGFVQYQFVLPKTAGAKAMTEILQRISHSKRGSFLAVLKAFGKSNDNYLSFPLEGYTLALDFKLENGLFSLLDELDHIVLNHGGRLYLTKDARMSEKTFKQGYSQWEAFVQVRMAYQAHHTFHSLQSRRLGL
jgi:FAD/FMN-containing dehydrogenase